eukprot:361635-Chlamydomonas_euryale.AAC.1
MREWWRGQCVRRRFRSDPPKPRYLDGCLKDGAHGRPTPQIGFLAACVGGRCGCTSGPTRPNLRATHISFARPPRFDTPHAPRRQHSLRSRPLSPIRRRPSVQSKIAGR